MKQSKIDKIANLGYNCLAKDHAKRMSYKTKQRVYYGVMPCDGIAILFDSNAKASRYCKTQFHKYGISCLLLTCHVGIV